jgi:nitrite reductase/ring-hydroxylating ferredoxin subunit
MHGYVFSMKTGELVAPRGLCGDQRTFVTKVVDEEVEIWDAFDMAIHNG